MVNVSFLQELLNGIAERGRTLLPRALVGGEATNELVDLARALVSGRGEASGVALARQILERYATLDKAQRQAFFTFLAKSMGPNLDDVKTAAEAFAAAPSSQTYRRLTRAAEPPRQEFFRRLNLAPGATAAIVAMRRHMLEAQPNHPEIADVDADLMHLLVSWFNRGFLVLRRIDWSTPANILEKIIEYEAVHEIQGWDDLRRRLDPIDRRCFAFFHPALIDEPLIFVEVALTRAIPGSIQELLAEEKAGHVVGQPPTAAAPTTAVFYSISNCQDGLRGISFGNFLIKQVVEELVREVPTLKTFVTLSPVPKFAAWLADVMAHGDRSTLTAPDRIALQVLQDPSWADEPEGDDGMRPVVLALAAHYFLEAKAPNNRPLDPVARFHLGNGARLERINWRGDISQKGLREAHGLMVNYLYEIKDIEKNHELYANTGAIAASRGVRALLRPPDKTRPATVTTTVEGTTAGHTRALQGRTAVATHPESEGKGPSGKPANASAGKEIVTAKGSAPPSASKVNEKS